MKKIALMMSLFSVVVAQGQYIHFNNNYQLAGYDSSPLAIYTCLIDSAFYTYGFNFTNDEYENVNTRLKVDIDGNMVNYFVAEEITDNPINGFGGYDNNAGFVLPDKSVICQTLTSYYCAEDDDYKSAFGLIRYYDTAAIWNFTYENLEGSCQELKEYQINGLQLMSDTSFMVWSTLLVDSAEASLYEWHGLAFTYFNFDGDVLAHYETFDNERTDFYRHLIKRENDFILTGSADNSSLSHVVAKFDFQANLIDSLHFGNPDTPNGGAGGAIMDDGTMSYMYAHTTYWNSVQELFAVEQDIHFARIDLDNMEVINDFIITSPTDGLYFPYGLGVTNCIHTTDNKLVCLCGYADEGSVLAEPGHVMLWQMTKDGEILWQNEYIAPVADGYRAQSALLEAPDGGYLARGENWEPDWSYVYTWLLKIDACGYEQPSGCPAVVGIEGDSRHPELDSGSFPVWPNPFYNSLKAALPPTVTRVFISDATDRIVFEENVFYPNQTWNLSALADGVYVMRVELESGQVISERIVKQ